jgi:hypothetical protein
MRPDIVIVVVTKQMAKAEQQDKVPVPQPVAHDLFAELEVHILVYQVQQLQPTIQIPLRNRHHQPHIRLHHPLIRPLQFP